MGVGRSGLQVWGVLLVKGTGRTVGSKQHAEIVPSFTMYSFFQVQNHCRGQVPCARHSLQLVMLTIPQLCAGVEVLAQYQLTPEERASQGRDSVIVAVREGHLLATAFHPELTSDVRLVRASRNGLTFSENLTYGVMLLGVGVSSQLSTKLAQGLSGVEGS